MAEEGPRKRTGTRAEEALKKREQAEEEEAKAKREPKLWEIPKDQRIFDVGKHVEAFGLTSESGRKLNGKVGVISAVEELKGRYLVKFPKIEDAKSLKPENIKVASFDTRWRAGNVARVVRFSDGDEEHEFVGCLGVLVCNPNADKATASKTKAAAKQETTGEASEEPKKPEEPRWIVEIHGQWQIVLSRNLRVCTQDDEKSIWGWSWSSLILLGISLIVTMCVLIGVVLAILQVIAARIEGDLSAPGPLVGLLSFAAPCCALLWIIAIMVVCTVLHEPLRDAEITFVQFHELAIGVSSARLFYRIGWFSVTLLVGGMLLLYRDLVLPHLPGGRQGEKGAQFMQYAFATLLGVAAQGLFLGEVKWSLPSMAHFAGYAMSIVGTMFSIRAAGPLYMPEQYLPGDEVHDDDYHWAREASEQAVASKFVQQQFAQTLMKARHNVIAPAAIAISVITFVLVVSVRGNREKLIGPNARMRTALALGQWLVVLSIAITFLLFGLEPAVAALLPLPSEGGYAP